MLNHEETGKHAKRITKIKPFINEYKWEGIHFPSEKDNWKKVEKIMQLLLLMFFMLKKKKYILLVSKHNSNREKQVTLLIILNGEGCEEREGKDDDGIILQLKKTISIINRNNV